MNHLTPARHTRTVSKSPICSTTPFVRLPAAGTGISTRGPAIIVTGDNGYSGRGTGREHLASLTTVGALANSSGLQIRLTQAVQHS